MTAKEVKEVYSYDGQTIWGDKHSPLYEVGNFLGGGAAGKFCSFYNAFL